MMNRTQFADTNHYDTKSKTVNSNNVTANRTVAVVPKYAPMLYTLLFLLLIDFLLNSFNELAKIKSNATALLVLYM